jgi:hypothetical protein
MDSISGAYGGLGGQFAFNRVELSIGQTAPLINVATGNPCTLFVQAENNWPKTLGGVITYPITPLDLTIAITRRNGSFVHAVSLQLPVVGLCLPILAENLQVQVTYGGHGLATPWPTYIISAAVSAGVYVERPVYRSYKQGMVNLDQHYMYAPQFTSEFRIASRYAGEIRLVSLNIAATAYWDIANEHDCAEWRPIAPDTYGIIFVDAGNVPINQYNYVVIEAR